MISHRERERSDRTCRSFIRLAELTRTFIRRFEATVAELGLWRQGLRQILFVVQQADASRTNHAPLGKSGQWSVTGLWESDEAGHVRRASEHAIRTASSVAKAQGPRAPLRMADPALQPEIPARRNPAFDGDVPTTMRTQMCGDRRIPHQAAMEPVAIVHQRRRCRSGPKSRRSANPKKNAGEIAPPSCFPAITQSRAPFGVTRGRARWNRRARSPTRPER